MDEFVRVGVGGGVIDTVIVDVKELDHDAESSLVSEAEEDSEMVG